MPLQLISLQIGWSLFELEFLLRSQSGTSARQTQLGFLSLSSLPSSFKSCDFPSLSLSPFLYILYLFN